MARPLQTRFPYGSGCPCLNLATKSNSLVHSPKGTPSHIPSEKGIVLRPLVDAWFQILFHSPHRGSFHLSLTVLVRYRSSRVFSLGPWSTQLPTGFLVSRGTQESGRRIAAFAYRAVTVSGRPFQCLSTSRDLAHSCVTLPRHLPVPTTPDLQHWQVSPQIRFGLLPFRSPLLREYSLFLRVLRCFSSPRSPHSTYVFSAGSLDLSRGVSPFGYPRLFACTRLTEAFRSVPRPSSALVA